METMMLRLWVALTLPTERSRDERGDVPGWVMITVMTAGLVVVIWQIAGDQLGHMLRAALHKVR